LFQKAWIFVIKNGELAKIVPELPLTVKYFSSHQKSNIYYTDLVVIGEKILCIKNFIQKALGIAFYNKHKCLGLPLSH
jgi:hypothetical protein